MVGNRQKVLPAAGKDISARSSVTFCILLFASHARISDLYLHPEPSRQLLSREKPLDSAVRIGVEGIGEEEVTSI